MNHVAKNAFSRIKYDVTPIKKTDTNYTSKNNSPQYRKKAGKSGDSTFKEILKKELERVLQVACTIEQLCIKLEEQK